jgi:hypothetical protein
MNRPEPPPKTEGVPVTPELFKWLDALTIDETDRTKIKEVINQRCEYGLKKYNQVLMTKDGRDDVIDAMQEMGDLLQYSYKAKLNGRLPELKEVLVPFIEVLYDLLDSPDI